MAVTTTLTQTRPNTGVAFHNASDDFKAVKQEMVDAGTLVDNGGGNNETDLTRIWTLTFTNEDTHTAFENDARTQSYVEARESYNLANGITETID